jgi:hypothetical protein
MTSESIQYLAALHKEIDDFFSFDEIKTLCFDLGVDHENIPGEIRSAFIRNLIVSLARQKRLQVLLDRVREERPSVAWPDIPADFELPEAIAQEISLGLGVHPFTRVSPLPKSPPWWLS